MPRLIRPYFPARWRHGGLSFRFPWHLPSNGFSSNPESSIWHHTSSKHLYSVYYYNTQWLMTLTSPGLLHVAGRCRRFRTCFALTLMTCQKRLCCRSSPYVHLSAIMCSISTKIHSYHSDCTLSIPSAEIIGNQVGDETTGCWCQPILKMKKS